MKEATKKCRACHADIPLGAKVCQHCRAKQGNFFARHWILTTLLVLFILMMASSGGEAKSIAKPEQITMAEFSSIENGMTYDQVVEIIGSKGEVLSDNEIAGIKTTMYMFKGFGISNANIMIQNGKVVSKAQMGLK